MNDKLDLGSDVEPFPESFAVPLGSNATFTCDALGNVSWKVNETLSVPLGPYATISCDAFGNAFWKVNVGPNATMQLAVYCGR